MAATNKIFIITFELINFEDEEAGGIDDGGSQVFPLNLANNLDKNNWSLPVLLSASLRQMYRYS